MRQPHQLDANQRHVHLIEIKYCEDTRSEQQLEAAQRQHADLCKLISLGVGGTCCSEHTPNQLVKLLYKQLGLNHQCAIKLACKLHVDGIRNRTVAYANKLVTTRCAIENNNTSHSQVLEPGASTSSSPSSSCSHYALRSRNSPTQRTGVTNRVRQPRQLNANQRHVHLIEIKYCIDNRPGQQLEAAQQQHADLSKLINAKVVTLHTILLGVGGTCCREHTLNQSRQLGLDQQHALKLARNLHAHSVKYAHRKEKKNYVGRGNSPYIN
eukprot:1140655-Pelagomonas_calceolata.AAC.1